MDKVIELIWNSDGNGLEECLQKDGNANAIEADTSALLWACAASDPRLIDILVKYGADVNFQSGDGETALIKCSYLGPVEAVKILLDNNANVDDADEIGQTALMASAKAGRLDIVKLLVRAGAKVEKQDINGLTALHWAMLEDDNPAVVEYLLYSGVDREIRDANGGTATDYAKQLKRTQALQVLTGGIRSI